MTDRTNSVKLLVPESQTSRWISCTSNTAWQDTVRGHEIPFRSAEAEDTSQEYVPTSVRDVPKPC